MKNARTTTRTPNFNVNDRVYVVGVGYGTVMAFYASRGPGYVDLVDVALDDSNGGGLFEAKLVKKEAK